ncbi:DUF1237 domain-containing protein [Pyricularia oryzae Y34]|uniref:DUF1237 domain-containing protein n=2 Tax=Pyricularia oryzae TaxID=318829 RepID=A0AA97PPA7_PYRO3|nr:DUF1237 domain-containing protein [Pyricularia oryzae Y34]
MGPTKFLFLLPLLAHLAEANAGDSAQVPLHGFEHAACPDYASYSKYKHPPFSDGPLKLPYQRPDPRCRTFNNDAIEKVIKDVTSRMKDPDMARLFENAFPSTTDTTVKFHTDGKTKHRSKPHDEDDDFFGFGTDSKGAWEGPQSFIITGDIIAEWLRDSTNQLAPYQPLAQKNQAVRTLILGAINTQAEYIIQSPYCNAFQPPPIANLPISHNGQDDTVHPNYDPNFVFECKYELDSLAHFLAIGNDFFEETGSTEFVNSRWLLALDTLLIVLEQQAMPTFNSKTGSFRLNQYTFQRRTTLGTETLNLQGVGNPLGNGTGLVRSAFRPSDDASILGFFIPANAMMAVELGRAAKALKAADMADDTLTATVERWSKTITEAVWEHGVVKHKTHGDVFAYEVDGYGSAILMDDANYPSLLALPVMGFVSKEDKIYQNTRKMLLSKQSNPYYLEGRDFRGIGGPHIGLQNAWPMSLLMQAQTTDDDEEIQGCLQLVLKSALLGLVHESVDVNQITSYTRSWFAYLAKRKPYLIFKDSEPYVI